MDRYYEKRSVTQQDLDELNHMNNVRYVQWIQDIAKAHWDKNATTKMHKRYFWVVRNHTIDYLAEAKLNDVISIETYVSHSDGYASIREVEMTLAATGKKILKSKTTWILMSAKTLKPTRLTEELKTLFA